MRSLLLLLTLSLSSLARARDAPPVRAAEKDRFFDIAPYEPIYLGSEQWARVMTPIPASQAYIIGAGLWEGTRIARRRLEAMGRFQDREVWGSVQVYRWTEEVLSPALVRDAGVDLTRSSVRGLHSYFQPDFSTIILTGSKDDEVLWRNVIHEVAHHWYASPWRRGAYSRDESEAFARACARDALPLSAWRRLPANQRYRPDPPRVTPPTLDVSAHIIPLDLTITVTATVE